jgi:hypothetical protein
MDVKDKILANAAEKKIEGEFAQCSAKFQKLFKDQYVRFN